MSDEFNLDDLDDLNELENMFGGEDEEALGVHREHPGDGGAVGIRQRGDVGEGAAADVGPQWIVRRRQPVGGEAQCRVTVDRRRKR